MKLKFILSFITPQNIIIVLLIASLGSVAVMYKLWEKEHKNRLRFQNNQTVLMTELETFKTKDERNAASINSLNLTVKELKQNREDLVKEVENLGIELRRVKSITQTGFQTVTQIETVIKDSLIYVEGQLDTVKCIDYITPYLTLQGCIIDDLFKGVNISRDTMSQVINIVPKKFLFIKYGAKGINQIVSFKNPNSEIYYDEYIEITKR